MTAAPPVPPDDRLPALVLAQVDGGTLARSLLVAALLVSPYWWWKRRQVRALRAERQAAAAGDAEPGTPTGPRLEDVVEEIHALAAAAVRDGSTATVTVPHGVTVGGRDAPPELVDALVRDALRRSGLAATAEVDTPAGRVIECRPA